MGRTYCAVTRRRQILLLSDKVTVTALRDTLSGPCSRFPGRVIYELKGVLNQGYYRNQGKSSQKDSARRRTVLARFFTVFDTVGICWGPV